MSAKPHSLWKVRAGVGFAFLLLGAGLTVASRTQAAESRPELHTRPPTALVLSGGGARGLAHVGVLKELERMQIPYDCIVGTSMGAIAGGSFATGISTQDAEKKVVEADWTAIFSDKPSRSDIPYFRKYEDYKPYFDFTLTLDQLKLKMPKNFVGVQKIGLFFRELTNAAAENDFDNLQIPYRAVATDVITGEPVVIQDGVVAEAMRASMTIPGLFPPLVYKGHTLVDGGLSKNLPVSVGRELCGPGSRVIAVNVSTPSLKAAELTSFFSIAEQTVNISMQRNMSEEVANITPQDVLITPALEGYTSADFEKAGELIRVGQQAVMAQAQALQRFRVDAQEYAKWKEKIKSRKKPAPVVSRVEMTKMQWVNPEVMTDLLAVKTDAPFDMAALHRNIDKVYARGDFSSISYDLIPLASDAAVIKVDPQEKDGRDFVRFGLSLYSDFQGDSSFNALASLRRGWLNRLGAEWRTDVQVGEDTAVYSEWYQPATLNSAFFLAPYALYTDQNRDIYVPGLAKLKYQFQRYGGGLELGSVFGRWGEVRVGAVAARAAMRSDTLLVIPEDSYKQAGVTVRSTYDQLDDVNFPHTGSSVRLNYFSAITGMGAEADYNRLDFRAVKAFTRSRNTLLATVHMGSDINSDLPYYDTFSLGGLFNMSAYPPGYVMGGKLAYASLISYRRFSDLPHGLGKGIYGGMQFEAARMGHIPAGFQEVENPLSLSAYLAADTVLGPVYLLGAMGNNDQKAAYLALGVKF